MPISQTTACIKPSFREDDNMLLAKQVLNPAAKKHFGLFRDPFADEVIQSNDDIFTTPDIRYVREALYQTARHGGFIAICGESGAGKTTLRRDLADRINRENAPVVIIEPYIIAMEDNDAKGKTLKAASIAEAIINTLAGERQTLAGGAISSIAPGAERVGPRRVLALSDDRRSARTARANAQAPEAFF